MVVQTLAHNSTCTLAVVKDFITRKLKEESEQIAKVENSPAPAPPRPAPNELPLGPDIDQEISRRYGENETRNRTTQNKVLINIITKIISRGGDHMTQCQSVSTNQMSFMYKSHRLASNSFPLRTQLSSGVGNINNIFIERRDSTCFGYIYRCLEVAESETECPLCVEKNRCGI